MGLCWVLSPVHVKDPRDFIEKRRKQFRVIGSSISDFTGKKVMMSERLTGSMSAANYPNGCRKIIASVDQYQCKSAIIVQCLRDCLKE